MVQITCNYITITANSDTCLMDVDNLTCTCNKWFKYLPIRAWFRSIRAPPFGKPETSQDVWWCMSVEFISFMVVGFRIIFNTGQNLNTCNYLFKAILGSNRTTWHNCMYSWLYQIISLLYINTYVHTFELISDICDTHISGDTVKSTGLHNVDTRFLSLLVIS